MTSAAEMEMVGALSPDDKKRVGAMIRAGRNPSEALRSVVDQSDAYEREQPTPTEEVAAAATGAANALAPSPAIMSASPLGVIGGAHMKALRMATGADKGAEAAAEAAPGAFGGGALAGDALGAILGPGGAGASKTAGAAAKVKGSGAALADIAKSIGGSKGARIADVVTDGLPVIGPLKEAARKVRDIAREKPAAPPAEATSSPVPELGKTGLRAVYDDLVKAKAPKPAAKAADDVDYAKEADGFDEGGEGFLAWLKQQTPPSATKAVEKGRAQVAGTKVDRTPAKGGDLRADAVQRISVDDVGAAAPKTPPGPAVVAGQRVDAAKYKPQDGNVFLEQEAARASEAAGRAWKSLPLSPVGQPKPAMTTEALRAEARAAWARGEPIESLAKRLGLNKTDRNLVAVFEAAKIGN